MAKTEQLVLQGELNTKALLKQGRKTCHLGLEAKLPSCRDLRNTAANPKFCGVLSECSEKVKVKSLSPVRLFATTWTVAQAPPSMGFGRGLPFLSPGDLPDPGIEPGSPALRADSLPSEPPGRMLSRVCLKEDISATQTKMT